MKSNTLQSDQTLLSINMFFQQFNYYKIKQYIRNNHNFDTIMNAKTIKKKQQKVVEDRTFGLKNKNKSKTVQNYVKGVQNTVKNSGKSPAQLEAEQFQKKKLKKKAEEQAALLNALFATAKKIGADDSDEQDEDPQNTVCPYFKQGLCQKGKKCLYSHDLTLDRTEQIDLYVDQRTQLIMNAIGGKQMGMLTEDQLNKLLGEKQREMMKGTRSKIVCKNFLEAVEKDKYGWKWNCINGELCKYKHCLPPGYKLKKDQLGKAKIQIDQIPLQERIDQQRNALLSQGRKSPLVTFDLFMKWKEQRRIRKEKQLELKKKEEAQKKGVKGILKTGVQLFKYDPTLFVDDEQAVVELEREQFIPEQEQEEQTQKIYEEREDGEDQGEQEDYQNQNQQNNQQEDENQKTEEISQGRS